MTADQHLNIR